MKGHVLTSKTKDSNIDKVHDFGVYIGNNHFVTKNDINFLHELIIELEKNLNDFE